ncbi:hypothetical protein AQ490_10770 [Wenjunlia vitaminophila]|uniref:Ribbon-helix-helix protein CopG domain-containing protein n=1 Tax=Wenjunlia vitaminophila TaxID=76728 RepID=A0A0T6LK07_WENVI|nr:hypothetical protein [Wenjunlia vitaminophila]KRV46394.1 hypothetical protein AQ490_10770 [Wenjunlia vitaminophila]
MSLERITITIPSETLAAARAAAERDGLSVSAWLSRAAAWAAKIEDGLAAANEVLAELGPPGPEGRSGVDALVDLESDAATDRPPATDRVA